MYVEKDLLKYYTNWLFSFLSFNAHIRSKKLIEDSTKHLKDIEDTLKVSLRK